MSHRKRMRLYLDRHNCRAWHALVFSCRRGGAYFGLLLVPANAVPRTPQRQSCSFLAIDRLHSRHALLLTAPPPPAVPRPHLAAQGAKGDRKALHASCPTLKVRGPPAPERTALRAVLCRHNWPLGNSRTASLLRGGWGGASHCCTRVAAHRPCACACAWACASALQGMKWTATKWIHNKPYMGERG